MFKPHVAVCVDCKAKTLVVVKKMLCKRCNERQKTLKKVIQGARMVSFEGMVKLNAAQKVKELKNVIHFIESKTKKRKATGEANLFKKCWEEREHVCENCKANLGNEAKAHFFSHIISKKRRPDLRLDPKNIQLLCYDCHYAYDFRGEEAYKKRKK